MHICLFWTSHEPETKKWEDRQNAREAQEPNSAVKAPTVLATCPGTVGSLLGAAFLAVKADHALCHSWGAVLPNCLFSTTLSSISLLTAPLQLENAKQGPILMPDFWKSHSTRNYTVWKFVKRVLCQETVSTSTKPGQLPHIVKTHRPAHLCLQSKTNLR